MTGAPVRLNAINMNGQPDADGDVFVVTNLPGLWEAPMETDSTQRDDIGSRIDIHRYQELLWEIEGYAYSLDNQPNDVHRLTRKLRQAYWPTGFGTVYIDYPSPGTPVQLVARRYGAPDFPAPQGNVQQFTLPMISWDPRKYSQVERQEQINSGIEPVTNHGTIDTPVYRAELLGTATDPWIRNNSWGPALVLAGSIPAGSYIDFAAKRTYHASNGLEELANRPRTWWLLRPGEQDIEAFGSWEISYRDAYI